MTTLNVFGELFDDSTMLQEIKLSKGICHECLCAMVKVHFSLILEKLFTTKRKQINLLNY